jgi:diaminohydroxyphosphoribosylaminopyrimidine deaminase/5-amino-6-(5-phosphoribosylamino)uracil reductase
LVEAGVARVVVACRDPDPRVNGAGIDTLKSAGVEVVEGVLDSEARDLNLGFFRRVETNRPMVTLKLAASIDGRIATSAGHSKWITGPVARAHGHGLRARHDAVVVGAGTVMADDPALTCRLPGMGGRSPVRVVLAGHRAIPTSAKIVTTAKEIPTWVLTTDAADPDHRAALESQGVEVHSVAADADGHPDLKACLKVLGDKGITRVMVEGGWTVAAAFLRSEFVDRLVWARGAQILGGDGLAAVGELSLGAVDDAPKFRHIETLAAGDDFIETYAVDRI